MFQLTVIPILAQSPVVLEVSIYSATSDTAVTTQESSQKVQQQVASARLPLTAKGVLRMDAA